MNSFEAVDAYLAGPKELSAAVAGMSREQLLARPIPGKWSTLEVVCHLVDADANIAYRIKRVLAEDQPTFERLAPDRMLAALAYHDRDVAEELAIFDLTRRQIARILRASSPEAWERTGIVTDRGARTIAQMVNGAIDHLKHHLRFVVEKRHALGLGDLDSVGFEA
jgi:DinB superfamily